MRLSESMVYVGPEQQSRSDKATVPLFSLWSWRAFRVGRVGKKTESKIAIAITTANQPINRSINKLNESLDNEPDLELFLHTNRRHKGKGRKTDVSYGEE